MSDNNNIKIKEDKSPAERQPQKPMSQLTPSTGSATGSLRNKVALKPGFSLMGWVKLAASVTTLASKKTSDITSEITPDELAKHNTTTDCWTALNGHVYDVTKYLDYHPGGSDELMRAAGRDGTDLFNEVHRWVNYESLLAKCIVGTYRNNATGNFKTLTTTTTSLASSDEKSPS